MVNLYDKIKGCIAGSWAGSAMGAVVEGLSSEKIKEKYGILDKFQPYSHYIEYTSWLRPEGTTEDGIERQKLIATAIIEKKDRISCLDLAEIWKRDLDPEKMIYKQEPYDRSLYFLLKSGMPAVELGRLSFFQNVVTMARSSHPLGLINAGDPQSAADDTFEVGKLYLPENAFGLRWAALYNAAVASACRPDANILSVVETALEFSEYRAEKSPLYKGINNVEKFSYDKIKTELTRALEFAEKSRGDPEYLKQKFKEVYYGGEYITYGLATAAEIVSKAFAVFYLHKGNTKDAVITSVNFGRDTDCLAACTGGLCGALTGIDFIPHQWIEKLNDAVKQDPYTNSKRTIEETADGIYNAFCSRYKKISDYINLMKNYNL